MNSIYENNGPYGMVPTGAETRQAIWLNQESHKLNKAYSVNQIAPGVKIYNSQPVKLTPEGLLTPALAADAPHLIIGHSIHDADTTSTGSTKPFIRGGEVTVYMKGSAVVTALAGAVLTAGPVKYSGIDEATGYMNYIQATGATDIQGWAEMAADAIGDVITVVLI